MSTGDNIIRKYRSTGFTQINNAMLDNPKMSLKSKALLAILLSCRDGWHFYMSDLVGRSTDGKDSVLSARRELEQLRYVICTTGRGNAGKFGGLAWHISDTPFTLDEYREITEEDFPRRLSRDGKSSTNNTKQNNTNLNNSTDEQTPGEMNISSFPGVSLNQQSLSVAVAEFAEMHPPLFRAAPPLDALKKLGLRNVTGIRSEGGGWKLKVFVDPAIEHEYEPTHQIGVEVMKYLNDVGDFVDEMEIIAAVGVEDTPEVAEPSSPQPEAARPPSESPAERLARLRKDPIVGVLTAEREETLKRTRRHFGQQGAIRDQTLQAIYEFIPENYPLIKQLMKDTGMKPEKMLEYLKTKPNIIGPLKVLKKNDYPALLEAARTEAAKHTEGWRQYTYIHLIDSIVKKVTDGISSTKPKRSIEQARVEMRGLVGAAPSWEEALSIVQQHIEQGEGAVLGRRTAEEYVTLIWGEKK